MPKEKRLTVKLDEVLHNWFNNFAERRGISKSEIIRDYLLHLQRIDEGKIREKDE